jgi:transcriptional regulator with XRE-family HTH domain
MDMQKSADAPEPLRRIGLALRVLRKRKGLTQQELASGANLDRSYVGGVERGERNFSVLALARILNAMGVTWVELAAVIDSGPAE